MFHGYVSLPEGNSWLPAQVISTHPRLRVTFLGSSKFKSSTKPPARLKPPPILSGAVGPEVILLGIHHMFPMVSRLFLFIFDLPSILRLPSHVPTMFQQLWEAWNNALFFGRTSDLDICPASDTGSCQMGSCPSKAPSFITTGCRSWVNDSTPRDLNLDFLCLSVDK